MTRIFQIFYSHFEPSEGSMRNLFLVLTQMTQIVTDVPFCHFEPSEGAVRNLFKTRFLNRRRLLILK